MIFRIDGKLITINRIDYRNDLDYYTKIYEILIQMPNTAKSNPTNKILSAMFRIE